MAAHGERREIAFHGPVAIRRNRFVKIVERRRRHRRHRQEKRELECGRSRKPGRLTGSDRAHRARSSGENRGQNLRRANPCGLPKIHLVHLLSLRPGEGKIDNPHDDAADQNRPRDHPKIFQVLANLFFQRPGRDRCDDKSDHRQTKRMRQNRAVAAVAAGKRSQELHDAFPKVNGQRQDGAELNNDCVHLPETVVQIEFEERFNDTQMRRRTNGQKFREAFYYSEQDRQEKVVHARKLEAAL